MLYLQLDLTIFITLMWRLYQFAFHVSSFADKIKIKSNSSLVAVMASDSIHEIFREILFIWRRYIMFIFNGIWNAPIVHQHDNTKYDIKNSPYIVKQFVFQIEILEIKIKQLKKINNFGHK